MQSLPVLVITFAILPLTGGIKCRFDQISNPKKNGPFLSQNDYTCDADVTYCATIISPSTNKHTSLCAIPYACKEEGCFSVKHNNPIPGAPERPNSTICCCKGDSCNADKDAIVAAVLSKTTPSAIPSAAVDEPIRADYCNGQPAC